MTIYEKSQDGLIKTGQRAVATFPSSLCRVDRVFIAKRSAANFHRATFAVGASMPEDTGEPSIDGLYIFPAATEQEIGDGFTEFRVSAYGRTSNLAQVTQLTDVFMTESQLPFNTYFRTWQIEGQAAVLFGSAIDFSDLTIDSELLLPFAFESWTNPTWEVLSVTEDEVVSASGVAPVGGDTFSLRAVPLVRRKYTVTFQEDGVEVPGSAQTFWLADPKIEIVAVRNFGKFNELEFTTTRQFLSLVEDES
jgi:hypothetical protein